MLSKNPVSFSFSLRIHSTSFLEKISYPVVCYISNRKHTCFFLTSFHLICSMDKSLLCSGRCVKLGSLAVNNAVPACLHSLHCDGGSPIHAQLYNMSYVPSQITFLIFLEHLKNYHTNIG